MFDLGFLQNTLDSVLNSRKSTNLLKAQIPDLLHSLFLFRADMV